MYINISSELQCVAALYCENQIVRTLLAVVCEPTSQKLAPQHTLHHTAPHCNTLQHAATRCNILCTLLEVL